MKLIRQSPLAFLLLSEAAFSLSIKLDKETYLPGEPMQIECAWPSELPEDANYVYFRSLRQSTPASGESRAVSPRASLYYPTEFPTKKTDCVKLRAPWLPGKYRLVAEMQSGRELDSATLTVAELPPQNLLTYVGNVSFDRLGVTGDGMHFVYQLTIPEDRCYPNNFRPQEAEFKDIGVFLFDTDSGQVTRANNSLVMLADHTCVDHCENHAIHNQCRPTGTFELDVRAPQRMGSWQIAIGQRHPDDSTCGADCIAVPEGAISSNTHFYRILDQVAVAPPAPVKKIYFSTDRDGNDIIAADSIPAANFYIWVEFEKLNPYDLESVEVTLTSGIGGSTTVDVMRHEDSPTLYRSRTNAFGIVDRGELLDAILESEREE